MEGVEVDQSRVSSLLSVSPVPRDRDEAEVQGYRDALKLIHENHMNMSINTGTILQLHGMIRPGLHDSGKFKSRTGEIVEILPNGDRRVRFVPLSAGETPDAVARLVSDTDTILEEGRVPELVCIAAFNHDFLCIHPFRDGNGRISRLLLLLQLYRAGYRVGSYVSIERFIEERKERYYETLESCSEGWHEGNSNPWPYINYLLHTVQSAYDELDGKLTEVRTVRGTKTRLVREAIERLSGEFSVTHIEGACPTVSREMIRHILRQMKKEGQIECIGRGPGALWKKRV